MVSDKFLWWYEIENCQVLLYILQSSENFSLGIGGYDGVFNVTMELIMMAK